MLTSAEIFAYNADVVFTIYASFDGDNFDSVGSGFFVCSSGIAVTNHHVLVGWPYARIRTHSGQEFTIIGYYIYDIDNDLAIIQVSGNDFLYAIIGNDDVLRVGDRVYAIGSPFGHHNTFSNGIISRLDAFASFGIYEIYGMIQITVPIFGGNSGGALFNHFGEVIGVTTATYGSDIGFAVPISRVNLTGVYGSQYYDLPVGGAPVIDEAYLFGTWFWSGGYYVFNPDRSGYRLWDGIYDSFDWHISGSFIILTLAYGEEQWTLSVVSEDEIVIGGAVFIRFGDTPDEYLFIEGAWDWSGGWYVFNRDGSGSRVWDDDFATFRWQITNNNIRFLLHDGDETWSFNVISDNEINIGGARFTRNTKLSADAVTLLGIWECTCGWHTFFPDGTGRRDWSNHYEDFYWHIDRDTIVFTLPDGEQRQTIHMLYENAITVDGIGFTRLAW